MGIDQSFEPKDDEIIDYLSKKLNGNEEVDNLISEIEFYDFEPWELPRHSKRASDTVWHFFHRPVYSSKPGAGPITKRKTEKGVWKQAKGLKPVKRRKSGEEIGGKRIFAYHTKETPETTKRTGWVMHEFQATSTSSQQDIVLYKLKKKPAIKNNDFVERSPQLLDSVNTVGEPSQQLMDSEPSQQLLDSDNIASETCMQLLDSANIAVEPSLQLLDPEPSQQLLDSVNIAGEPSLNLLDSCFLGLKQLLRYVITACDRSLQLLDSVNTTGEPSQQLPGSEPSLQLLDSVNTTSEPSQQLLGSEPSQQLLESVNTADEQNLLLLDSFFSQLLDSTTGADDPNLQHLGYVNTASEPSLQDSVNTAGEPSLPPVDSTPHLTAQPLDDQESVFSFVLKEKETNRRSSRAKKMRVQRKI